MFNSGSVNTVPGHANKHYTTDILRDQLGFRGVTVSDWQDVENLMTKYKIVPENGSISRTPRRSTPGWTCR